MSRPRFLPDDAEPRLYRLMLVLAAAGIPAAFLARGWPGATGFLLGAGLSVLNFRRIAGMVSAIAEAAAKPLPEPVRKPSARLAVIRWLALAVAVYAIVKYFEVSLMAALLGLFVAVVAVLVEMMLELMFP